MICGPCKLSAHDCCLAPGTCPCQHRLTEVTSNGLKPTSPPGGAITKKEEDDAYVTRECEQ